MWQVGAGDRKVSVSPQQDSVLGHPGPRAGSPQVLPVARAEGLLGQQVQRAWLGLQNFSVRLSLLLLPGLSLRARLNSTSWVFKADDCTM